MLGHSDVSFTYNVYIDIFDRDKQDAVMKFESDLMQMMGKCRF